jgi:hypothetical protein
VINIEINKKTIELGKSGKNTNKKPKIITYTVTRKFSGNVSYEDLLKQVIKDHS